MFIVLGSPRSGTTLLATTLSLHPAIKVLDQTDFIVPAAFVFDRVEDPGTGRRVLLDLISSSRYFPASIGPYLNRTEIDAILSKAPYELAALLELLYATIAGKCNKQRCGDKSVGDIGFFPILNRVGLFDSGIRIIHLVRDVRAVCASLDSLGWVKNRHIYPRSWANANLGIHDLLRGRDHYHFVRYEDMVVEPRPTFAALCEFLGFPYDPQMEKHSVRGQKYAGDSHHVNLQMPFLTEPVDRWRRRLSAELREYCETQASEALRRFGYAGG